LACAVAVIAVHRAGQAGHRGRVRKVTARAAISTGAVGTHQIASIAREAEEGRLADEAADRTSDTG
jgi:hypothetical protein